MVTADEIEEMKGIFQSERYENRFRGDITKNEYVTLIGTEQIIEITWDRIREILFSDNVSL